MRKKIMPDERDPLEQFWDDILSRQPDLIRAAFTRLNTDERLQLVIHLQRMASEPGWQPEQRKSALAALETIDRKTSQIQK
ncbi:MAG TPA: hypothetical protein VN452_08850 [Longilinea sp.]|nr:hypothetical protein [Longilinea sp.]